jgi:hypothetical protein
MIFTGIGRIIAWLCVLGGGAHWVYLQSIAIPLQSDAMNGGLAADQAARLARAVELSKDDYAIIAVGLALGILTEISRSLAKIVRANIGD